MTHRTARASACLLTLSLAISIRPGALGALGAQAAHRTAQPPSPRRFPLTSTTGLLPHNVTVEAVTLAGRRGVRLAVSDSARRRFAQLPIEQQAQLETFAVLEGTDFSSGTTRSWIAAAFADHSASRASTSARRSASMSRI